MKSMTGSAGSAAVAEWLRRNAFLVVVSGMSHVIGTCPTLGIGQTERVDACDTPRQTECRAYREPKPLRLGLAPVPPIRKLMRAIAAS